MIVVQWIDKVKYHVNGSLKRHKARLVANGFPQTPRVDYIETFSLVARFDIDKIILSIAAQKKWPVYQMDVKSAFLYVYIDQEIYVDQPSGYEILGK